MKKIRNLLFIFVFLCVFALIMPNKVNAIGEPEIQSITVKQGNTVLQKEGNYYVANGYDKLYFSYELANVNTYGMGGYIEVYQEGEEYARSTGWYHVGYESEIYVDFDNEYVTYNINLCDDWDCDPIYDTKTIQVRFTKVAEMNDDVVYFTKAMQSGEEVLYDNERGGFTFNPLRDITFSLKGENLDLSANYAISCADYTAYYLGSELMNGLDHTCVVSNYHDNSFYLGYKLVGYSTSVGYKEEYITYPALYLDEYVESINDYTATIAYANYANVALSKVDDDYWGDTWHYLALSKYFDSSKPLKMHLSGTNYENKNYNISLTVWNGNTRVYKTDSTVSGNSLNNGYDAIFNGFNPGTTGGVRYLFRVTVDGVSKQEFVEYIYSNMQISINKIVQGRDGEELPLENGVYVADGFDSLYVSIGLTNYNPDEDVYIRLGNGTSSYRPNGDYDLDIDNFDAETSEFTIMLCADSDCNSVLNFDTFKVKLTHYNQIKNQKVYFYNVRQGGNTIPMTGSGTFTINDKQVVSMMVKGENVIEDATYTLELGSYGSGIQVLGSRLINGVELTGNPQYSDYMSINFRIGSASLPITYYDGTNYITAGVDQIDGWYYYFNFDISNTYNKSYTADLKYKNYPNNALTMDDSMYLELYVVDTAYHGTNKPLMYYLKGSGYENKNYTFHVLVTLDDGSVFYDRNFTVGGNAINAGTNVELTGLTLPLATNIDEIMGGEYGMPTYSFTVSLDDVVDEKLVRYNGAGANLNINPEIFFQNGKKNLSVFRGFANSGMYDTNVDVFRKYDKIYINFMGSGFDENTEYDYYVDYGYYTETDENELTFPNRVTNGKVTGEILNNVGVFVELNNNKNYQHPSYRFYVKKGNEILAFAAPVLYTTEKATLANVMLNTQNRDLYLYSEEYSYIATKSMPIDISVAGIGFDDNKDYEFEYCVMPVYQNGEYGYNDDTCKDVSFNGKDLNDGNVLINFAEDDIDDEVVGYVFSVYGEGDDYFGQGYFTITFVENKELLPSLSRYIIDDASDIIRNIRKQTTVTEFKNSITVIEGGTIKVFDKTGTTEVTGQIGTGMQGRVIDEYNRNFINIGIAVQGDTTGDGNISLTDLVKVKFHLLETEILEDVYEAAGNVDGTSGITITDLVQMSKDVTGIKELD